MIGNARVLRQACTCTSAKAPHGDWLNGYAGYAGVFGGETLLPKAKCEVLRFLFMKMVLLLTINKLLVGFAIVPLLILGPETHLLSPSQPSRGTQ